MKKKFLRFFCQGFLCSIISLVSGELPLDKWNLPLTVSSTALFLINNCSNTTPELYLPLISPLKSLYYRDVKIKKDLSYGFLKNADEGLIIKILGIIKTDFRKANLIPDEELCYAENNVFVKNELLDFIKKSDGEFNQILKKCTLDEQIKLIRNKNYPDEDKMKEESHIKKHDRCQQDGEEVKSICRKQYAICYLLAIFSDLEKKTELTKKLTEGEAALLNECIEKINSDNIKRNQKIKTLSFITESVLTILLLSLIAKKNIRSILTMFMLHPLPESPTK